VLIFSDAKVGARLGYVDQWGTDDTYLYAGEGQTGDQTMAGGNKAILEHRIDGRHLRLFEGAGGVVRYVGEFEIDSGEPWQYIRARQRDSEELRRVIRFKLRRVAEPMRLAPAALATGTAYRAQDEAVVIAVGIPRAGADPDASGRGLRSHRQLQNSLATLVEKAGLIPKSPAAHDPDFDIGWEVSKDHWVVVEVKSLSPANEIRQLRMGLGQVLDYADLLRQRYSQVTRILFLPRKPADPRWLQLAADHDVIVSWPESVFHVPGLGG
jgi:hypothetical protein